MAGITRAADSNTKVDIIQLRITNGTKESKLGFRKNFKRKIKTNRFNRTRKESRQSNFK